MRLLDRLQRRFGRFAVPNITIVLIFGQVLAYVLAYAKSPLIDAMVLVPNLVLEGQVWRLVTFLFLPPQMALIWAFFFWYLFFLMGTALEQSWGDFRYNAFLLIGWLATVGVSFLTPALPATALFLQASVFLAFAYLFPDFQLMLFFILPVKVKWLAMLQWLGYGYKLIVGSPVEQLAVLAAVCNFLVFFGRDILLRLRAGHRRMAAHAQRAARETGKKQPLHRCRICGITEQSHPEMDFRYCSKCAGACCYCQEHLRNHEHVVAAEEVAEPEK